MNALPREALIHSTHERALKGNTALLVIAIPGSFSKHAT